MQEVYILVEIQGYGMYRNRRNVRGYTDNGVAEHDASKLNELAKKGTTTAIRDAMDLVGDYTEATFKATRQSIVRQMNAIIPGIQDTGFHLSETTYTVETLEIEGL